MLAGSWRVNKCGSRMWRLLREGHRLEQRHSVCQVLGRRPVLIPGDKKRSVEVLYTEDSEHPDQKE